MQVYGTASEDMALLTFATPKLLCNMMVPAMREVPVNEYDYDKAGLSECCIRSTQTSIHSCANCLRRPRLHFQCHTGRCWRA